MIEDCCLVTGASGGIGGGICKALAKNHHLILCGRNKDKLSEIGKEIQNCNGENRYSILCLELKETEKVKDLLISFLKENELKVSSFIHAAGIAPLLPLRFLTFEKMQEVMKINFFSAVEIMKILLDRKVNGNHLKSAVFISSVAAVRGEKGMTVYSASKGALDSFMRSCAYELAPNVRVNSIQPGGINTHSIYTTQMTEDYYKEPEKYGYLLGNGSVEDIANMAEYLISDKAKWITGQTFTVDGGQICH